MRISGWASSFVIGVVKSYHTRTVHLSSKEGKVTKVPYFSSSKRGRGRERERERGGGEGRGEGERERGGNEKVMYSIILLKKDLDNCWITAVETR